MSKLSIGIVGLPNVGKSTLFNALLKKQVALAANYPFATIEPNIGVVDVPDARLDVLARVVNAAKVVPAYIEFYDIAGLVKGASTGEGLGNKFLSHIRECEVILYVNRIFKDDDVMHVAGSLDPIRDAQVIETELILADMQTLDKQNDRKAPALPEALSHIKLDNKTWGDIIAKLKNHLSEDKPLRTLELTLEEQQIIKPLSLLTTKPCLYAFNVSEDQLKAACTNEANFIQEYKLDAYAQDSIFLNAKLESDLAGFAPDEASLLMAEYGLTEPGLAKLIRAAYKKLGLISYLTAGEIEARAWTIKSGTNAQLAAGEIHTDFIKKFIKAEVVPYQKFVDCGGWTRAYETGAVTQAGRDYIVQDGDVVEFKIGG